MLESEEFRTATPYNEAFYQTMFMVKDFWAVPEYAELLTQLNARLLTTGAGASELAAIANIAPYPEACAEGGRMIISTV